MKKLSRHMSYNPHTLDVLEFERVCQIINSLADSEEARQKILVIVPYRDPEIVRSLLTEVEEIINAIQFDDTLPGMSMHNIRNIFPQLKVEGNILNIEEIVEVAENLELAHDIKMYFKERAEKYPVALQITGDIAPHDDIVKHIRKVITTDFEVADDATPELLSIRRKLQKTRSVLRKMVENTLAELSDEVISERIVTIRDNRYVIPVRDSMKKYVPGAVHDRSQSGKTLFIEPLATIESNNQLRELEMEEQVEINRILANITRSISSAVHDIERNQDVLVRMDIITAKARFGVRVEGIIPKINDEPVIMIKNGRHPLLDWKYRKNANGSSVVPLNIEIGGSVRTIVITGPNAGGKTVALKTLGLLTLMALSGMPVTADPDTSVFAPHDFFADIGDEQSIENDLSTFSSHMKQIVTILREAGPRTLVLLDELGGGTNPSDGEAIALAVLKKLTGVGAVTLSTSHHDGLKVFAHETEGVLNASMEFDSKHHRPTFVLKSGVPGSSYAFEIAAGMGLPEDVLKDAESLAGSEKKNFESLIAEMEQHTRQTEIERKIAASERMEMEKLKKEYEEKLEDITVKKQDILSEAIYNSKKIIEDTNRQMELLIKSIREKNASHKAIVGAKSVIRETTSNINELASLIPPKKKKEKKPVSELKKGLHVWVERIGTDAVVEEVMAGGMKARIRVGKSKATIVMDKNDISLGESIQNKSARKIIINVPPSSVTSQEINLRGMTFDEARDALDTFLDSLYTSGFETAHIIHGKGSGVLRKKIGKYLDKHEFIESWRLGNWNEGSFGVTVAKLKK